jgi:hypothetical protein
MREVLFLQPRRLRLGSEQTDLPLIIEGCALDPAPRDRGAASTEKSIADRKAKPFRTAERQSREQAAVS